MFLFFLILISSFFSLFYIHKYGKDDFMLFRKNIALGQVFDLIFSVILIGLLVSRMGYILLHQDMKYLNPLVFILIPYFPGLSAFFGLVGAIMAIFYFTKSKKYPTSYLFDLLTLSTLFVLPFFTLGEFIIGQQQNIWIAIFLFFVYTVLFYFSSKIIMPLQIKNVLKFGDLTLIFLLVISLIMVLLALITSKELSVFLLEKEGALFLLLFIFASFFLLFYEKSLFKKKR